MALCSESTGKTFTFLSPASLITISPAITRISLLATARSFPALIAASAGRKPPVPTIATSTMSTSARQAISRRPASPEKIRGLYASARRIISIFVSSTRQRNGARVSFAAAASFSALLFAATPTISIRSGISRATLSALSPIEPVAPRTTMRLRAGEFSILIDLTANGHESTRIHSWLRHANHQSQVEEQQRRGEKQTVQEIERAADSREQIPRVLYVRAALDDGFSQIAKYCGKSKKHSKNCRVGP